MTTHNIPSIFDLRHDEDGILRMPFNPHSYGIFNGVKRQCRICGSEFSQCKMKELEVDESLDGAIIGREKMYPYSVFYCRECWFANDISDASNWTA